MGDVLGFNMFSIWMTKPIQMTGLLNSLYSLLNLDFHLKIANDVCFHSLKLHPFPPFHVCRVCEKEGVKLVVDNISYDFVKGATIDYVEELIRSAFIVSKPMSHHLLDHHCCLDMFILVSKCYTFS